ncbi:hypothetical protein CLV30_13143 [Haloactinopolyspora alba]|uniref:Uncharacterized protein n=1 Tax=Haloactinopolyspora alba TaxID=648780 RepID=A0A2P8D708_9ACTN|nr:hypothetical protein CLV30_13143 [Haloactinopolyspora alba]
MSDPIERERRRRGLTILTAVVLACAAFVLYVALS